MGTGDHVAVSDIKGNEPFDLLVRKLALYFNEAIDSPHDFEELKRALYGRSLRPLVRHLVNEVHYEGIVSALLALRWHFSSSEGDDDRGINETRGLACEIVAWRFVSHLTHQEAIEYLCYELPTSKNERPDASTPGHVNDNAHTECVEADERSPLLDDGNASPNEDQQDDMVCPSTDGDKPLCEIFSGMTALEIAAVAGAKKFLSEKPIQRVINGIWKGDIIFWNSISTHSVKKVQIYNPKRSDPFCRLKVPLYLKVFEIVFFAAFSAFYYAVLAEKESNRVSASEIMLYIWLAAFSYNELGEFWDAGTTFYATDFWASWDLAIIAVGTAFFIARMIGIAGDNEQATNAAFDILSVEALFLVPRICSLLSLHPYFGMLLPALKEMTKDFVKFIGLVAILYIGFDTTFTFLARGTYTFRQMNWILVKVFFGSGYLDIADEISPILGAPLMLIFVCLTNILLITSLISLLSNSLTKVMEHARDEYLFVYSVYVLEASTSNRLTYFLPPLNLVPLLLRPLRLALPAESLRSIRIALLKATHFPFVGLIIGWESWRLHLHRNRSLQGWQGPNSPSKVGRSLSTKRMRRRFNVPDTARSPLVHGSAPLQTAAFQTDPSSNAVVAQLKAQVDALSELIAKQRQTERTIE